MLVKSKVSFVRDLLYLKEVLEAGSIKRAAEKNGIKASNLSKLMSDFEKNSGKLLFSRSTHGVVPTKESLEILHNLERLDLFLHELSSQVFNSFAQRLKLYVAKGICVPNIEQADAKFDYVEQISEADVMVDIKKPKRSGSLVVSETKLGQNVVHSIWVSCKNESQALHLATFIISQILG